MRGKESSDGFFLMNSGITPAYAGKSRQWYIDLAKKRDHPRLCGEKSAKPRGMVCEIGSPPPMRGKVGYRSRSFLTFRITPAYAGKSGKNER